MHALAIHISSLLPRHNNRLHTVDAIGLFSVLLLLNLLGLLLGLLLQILCLLELPKPFLLCDGVQDVGAFYQFRIVLPGPLIFQLFVFLSKY